MTTTPNPNPPGKDTAPDDAHYQAVLRTLIDQGAALAARIAATATAATTPDSALPEATIAFDRAARAVRRTIALARHIAATPVPAQHPAHDTRTKARTRLIRTVEDAIHVQHRVYEGDREALDREFAERLEDPALEFDLAGRDIDDVIQEICQDLGIAHPSRAYIYRRRTPRDVADLRTRAAALPAPKLPAGPCLGVNGRPVDSRHRERSTVIQGPHPVPRSEAPESPSARQAPPNDASRTEARPPP